MGVSKVAISLESGLVDKLDRLAKERVFPSRSRAVQEAVREKLERFEKTRLARECEKLDPSFEQKMAEEELSEEAGEWPPPKRSRSLSKA